jgi:hypothetical protein
MRLAARGNRTPAKRVSTLTINAAARNDLSRGKRSPSADYPAAILCCSGMAVGPSPNGKDPSRGTSDTENSRTRRSRIPRLRVQHRRRLRRNSNRIGASATNAICHLLVILCDRCAIYPLSGPNVGTQDSPLSGLRWCELYSRSEGTSWSLSLSLTE